MLKKQQESRGTNRHDSPAAENTEEVKALKKRAADAENRSKQLAENNAKLKEQRLKEAADQTLLEEGFQCSKAQQKKLAKQAKKEAQRSESEELPIDAPITPLDEEVDEPAVSLLVKVDISRIMKKASLPKAGKAKSAVTPEELAKSALAKLGDNTSAVLQDRSQQEQELAQWKKAIPSLSAGPVLDEINGKVKVLEQELAKSLEKLTTPKTESKPGKGRGQSSTTGRRIGTARCQTSPSQRIRLGGVSEGDIRSGSAAVSTTRICHCQNASRPSAVVTAEC